MSFETIPDLPQEDLLTMRKRIGEFFAESPIRIAIFVFFAAAIAVVFLSGLIYGYDEEFIKNIFVEAHGMLLDILIISVFLLWLTSLGEQKRERQRTIRRYREEIEDYLGWEEPEATFRIVGNIKRLNREGVSDIYLLGAYLKEASLWGANLESADLGAADLSGARLWKANLKEANLTFADLSGTNLSGADLSGADLGGADLRNADLTNAKVTKEQLDMAHSLNGAIMTNGTIHGA